MPTIDHDRAAQRMEAVRRFVHQARAVANNETSVAIEARSLLRAAMREDRDLADLVMEDAIERVVADLVGRVIQSDNMAIRRGSLDVPPQPVSARMTTPRSSLSNRLTAISESGWLDYVVPGASAIRFMTEDGLRSAGENEVRNGTTQITNGKFFLAIADRMVRTRNYRPGMTVQQCRLTESVLRTMREGLAPVAA